MGGTGESPAGLSPTQQAVVDGWAEACRRHNDACDVHVTHDGDRVWGDMAVWCHLHWRRLSLSDRLRLALLTLLGTRETRRDGGGRPISGL